MASNDGKKLIFGRYSREECGLPSAIARPPARLRLVLSALLLLLGLVVAGLLAGRMMVRWRAAWLHSLPAQVQQAAASDISSLLSNGRMYVTALPDRPDVAASLALAGNFAASRSPRRMGYYGNLVKIYDRLEAEPGKTLADFFNRLMAADVYSQVGEYARAFTALERAAAVLELYPDAEKRRSYALLLVNSQAYLLATAPKGAGRNPEKALHLAQLMLSSRDALPDGSFASESAALLDTLACAWYAANDAKNAILTQKMALGLADAEGLDEYLRHYDLFVNHAVQ